MCLSSNGDKRLQTFDGMTSYPYHANAGKVLKTELLQHLNIKWVILIMSQIKIKQSTI